MQRKNYIRVLLITLFLLVFFYLGNEFNNAVKWQLDDFLIAGGFILAVGLILEWAIEQFGGRYKRMLFTLSMLFLIFLLWAELGVGIFNTPIAGR